MFIQSNQFYGNWVSIAGEFNAPCAIMIGGNEKLDISGNRIYGRDALTDPQQAYAVGDETFGRAICMAGGNYTTWNVYIAKNDTKCIDVYKRQVLCRSLVRLCKHRLPFGG